MWALKMWKSPQSNHASPIWVGCRDLTERVCGGQSWRRKLESYVNKECKRFYINIHVVCKAVCVVSFYDNLVCKEKDFKLSSSFTCQMEPQMELQSTEGIFNTSERKLLSHKLLCSVFKVLKDISIYFEQFTCSSACFCSLSLAMTLDCTFLPALSKNTFFHLWNISSIVNLGFMCVTKYLTDFHSQGLHNPAHTIF